MGQCITNAAGGIFGLHAEPLNLVSYNGKVFSGSTGSGSFDGGGSGEEVCLESNSFDRSGLFLYHIKILFEVL